MIAINLLPTCRCGCGWAAPMAPYNDSTRGYVKGQPLRFRVGHSSLARSVRNLHHGHASDGKRSRELESFDHARKRCTNTNHHAWQHYGGRGIRFNFVSFKQFFDHLGPRPEGKSLDRYPDNNGHYEIGNVRWATRSEQSKNRRKWSK